MLFVFFFFFSLFPPPHHFSSLMSSLLLPPPPPKGMFASYEQTISVLLSPQIRPLIKGRDVACLCSGNPDEAREACATFRDVCLSICW